MPSKGCTLSVVEIFAFELPDKMTSVNLSCPEALPAARSCSNVDSGLQCVEEVMSLIAESLDAWRSRQYDYYQRVLNGIL